MSVDPTQQNYDAEPVPTPKIVVLVSGSGSNLQALIDACANKDINANISAVIANKPGVYGLERAQKANIATELIDHTAYDSRESFDQVLACRIEDYEPDLVILAGFMRILTPDFVQRFAGKLINIHPSLLPKYPGLNTHQRAIDAGDQEAGVTVHFVTEELDGGPPIVQALVSIDAGDDAASLAKKVLSKEHIIYPLAAKWFVEGRLALDQTSQNSFATLDKQPLPLQGLRLEDE